MHKFSKNLDFKKHWVFFDILTKKGTQKFLKDFLSIKKSCFDNKKAKLKD
ncbi:hypothetical protein G15_2909 [Enterococcus avium]|nr:hypothetical protein G15_2909 [Enterococcus avium]